MRNPYKHKRPAFCTGCGTIFPKMHQLRDHRHTFRCGGMFRVMGIEALEIPDHLHRMPELQSASLTYSEYPKAPKTGDNGWKAINPSLKKYVPPPRNRKNKRPLFRNN